MGSPTFLNLISTNAKGKKINRKITFVNPNATNENLNAFALALASLSDNTLNRVQKMQKPDLSEFRIIGTSADDWLDVGDECTVISGAGNDTLVFGADVSATVSDFSADDCVYLLKPVEDSAFFENGVLTLGNVKITVENINDISAFYNMTVCNGDTQTTVGRLLNIVTDEDVDAYLAAIFNRENVVTSVDEDFETYMDDIWAKRITQNIDSDVAAYFDSIFG